MKPTPTTCRALSIASGSGEKDIARWHVQAGRTKDGKPDYSDDKKSLAIIGEHQANGKGRPKNKKRNDKDDAKYYEPHTGLPWGQFKLMHDGKRIELENQEKAVMLSRDWMKVEQHLALLRALCNKLDQAPSMMKSQLGLTDEQRVGAQKIIDDLRSEFAKAL